MVFETIELERLWAQRQLALERRKALLEDLNSKQIEITKGITLE